MINVRRIEGLVVQVGGTRIFQRCACCHADVGLLGYWTGRDSAPGVLTCSSWYCRDRAARGAA